MPRQAGTQQQWGLLKRRLLRREEQAAKGLLRLLRDARRDVKRAILDASDAATGRELTEVRRGLDNAIGVLDGRMKSRLQTDVLEAVKIGGELGSVGGPRLALAFALDPRMLEQVNLYHADLIQDLTDALRAGITRRVQLGILAGKPLEQIAAEVAAYRTQGRKTLQPIGPFRTAEQRAMAIARTEVNRVANMATQSRMEAIIRAEPNKYEKVWVSQKDERTRPAHLAADGQTVSINAKFTVGGFKCKYPCDPALPAAQSVHCRCGMRLKEKTFEQSVEGR